MNRKLLLVAALVCALATQLPAQPDLIARIHFLGGDKISADPAHSAFTNEFCSAEAVALESQTLDKLSHLPVAWFTSNTANTNAGAAQLRPLLDDFLKSEWIFEIRDTTNGPPEYALAIRLNSDRAQAWSKNLQTLLQNWTGAGISQDKAGIWELKKSAPPLSFQFGRSGDWVVIDCSRDKLSLREEILLSLSRLPVPETNWLTADLNWPRLARIFPSLKEFDFPKIAMQIAGRDGNLQVNGKLTLSQPLPPLGNWRVPTNLIHQPLVSFTAARGIAPWLAQQTWVQPYQISPMPDQVFIWAMSEIPYQTYAAAPVPDAPATLTKLGPEISAVLDARATNTSVFKLAAQLTTNDIAFTGLPFVAPFVSALHRPEGDFLAGGFFPLTPRPRSMPPEKFAELAAPNLVFYHWENTSNRLALLPQLSQLILMVSGNRQLSDQSAAFKWLEHLGPTLGDSVTDVTRTAPTELTFTRRANAGLTAFELTALASWLEASNFPGCDLRLPPMPSRAGQRILRPLNRPAVPPPN